MNAIGLWAIAESMPDQTAVVEPDGRVVSHAELAAQADRYGRGLRALGLRPQDAVATLPPNSAAALAVYAEQVARITLAFERIGQVALAPATSAELIRLRIQDIKELPT